MYIHRSIETSLKNSLFTGKVVIVYGARQVGKTTLVKSMAKSLTSAYTYLNCDEQDVLVKLREANTSTALKTIIGDNKLIIIDEAQRIKNIGLKLKLLADNFPNQQIIATGSSSFELANEVNEPLTGRSIDYWLFPLSYSEILAGKSNLEINRELENLLIYGLYPDVYQTAGMDKKAARVKNLAENYLFKDTLTFTSFKNSEVVLKLAQALALQIGNEVSYNELATLVGVSKQTVVNYITLLEKSFIVFRLSPYSGNLRKELGKLRKIYFFDLGIRNALINNQNSLSLRDDVGKLWENFVIAEKYKTQLGPGWKTNLYFWRTYDQQEIDLIEDKGGRLFGWEIKWQNKKAKPPKAWTDTYPKASWQMATRDNFQNLLS